MKIPKVFSEKVLLKRMKKNKPKYSNLIKLLETKAKKQIPLNIKLILDKNTDDSENKTALEGLKLNYEINNNFNEIKFNIDESIKQNQNLFNRFKVYKSASDKDIIKKIEKKQNTFDRILKAYEDKGFYFQSGFINKNIYNKSGVLLRKKKPIEDYYSIQIKYEKKANDKVIKYENFYNKISREAQKRFIIKSAFKVQEQLEELERLYWENKNYDFERIEDLKKKRRTKKLIKENNLLKKLINIDKINFKKSLDKIEQENEKDDDKKFLNLNDNSINHDDKEENNIGSKTIYNNNNLSKITKENKSIFNDKDSIDNYNDDNINIIKKEIPKIYRTIFDKKYNTIISRDRRKTLKKISFSNSMDISSSNGKTNESEIFQSRLRGKSFANGIYVQKFPILYDKIKNRRKSNLEVMKIFNTNNSTDRTSEKKTFFVNNNSMPNFSSIEDTYDYLSKYKNKRNKVDEKLKEYFSENIKDIDKKNNGFTILNEFNELKKKVFKKNPLNKKIFIKYRDILPKDFNKLVILNNTVNRKIKDGVIDFSHHYFTKINKLRENDNFYDFQE